MRIELTEVIDHPVADVFSFYADDHLENHPRWDPDIRLSLATDGAVGIGTVFHRSHTHFGDEVSGVMEVIEFERDQAFGLVIDDGFGEMYARLAFEPIDDGSTQVRALIDVPDVEGVDEEHVRSLAERWLHSTEDLIDEVS